MKRVLFLLLVSVFMLPAFHSEAQVQGTQTPTHYQELTKQQQRQVKRDLRKKAREVANQQAFNAAVDALKDRNWVLMASTLYGPRGSAIPVSDNTNFIQLIIETSRFFSPVRIRSIVHVDATCLIPKPRTVIS